MKRLIMVLVGFWIPVLPCWAERPAAGPSGPNILVIMSDEHNAGVLGCYGNQIVRTPNLDRLARRGIVFDAAYTNSPLCVPSRLSFTACKYISRISAWNNHCKLPSDEFPSIARAMNAAGYESFLCGKMHYDRNHRYGFTDIGEGVHSNRGEMKGGGQRRKADNLDTANRGASPRFKDFKVGDNSSVMTHDRQVTRGVIQFLSGRKPGGKPFFLLAGYLAPHFPLTVPERFAAPYRGKVPMPSIPQGYLDSLPLNYKHLRVGFRVTDVDAETVRKGRELYYGLTSWVDDQIGQVLAALEASGLADNTVVMYTSDHGENMGEHGLWWKNCMFDTATRVPLIISYPPRWSGGQRRAGACSLVDVVKTVAEIGGATLPADCNGDSLCAWLDNPAAPWKDLAVSEYYAHHIASGYAMIRMGRYKYVYHTPADGEHPAERELYDLEADPGELKNLAALPGQQERIRHMHAALVRELGADPDETELRCREEMRRGYGAASTGGNRRDRSRRASGEAPAR